MQYLNDLGVKDLLYNEWHKVIERVEQAFLDPSAKMVPKIYLDGDGGDFRAMPAALKKYVSVKWIGVFPDNYQVSLPTTLGTLLLNDRETGKPLMAMDCATLTAYRTAATSAIAAKYCAPEAENFAFIGCGIQARYHIEAYETIFSHMKMDIQLYDTNESPMNQMFNWLGRENLCRAWGRNKSVKEAVKYADVITTLTPSTSPYLDIHDVKSDCHINAVGADAKGKRELMSNVIDGSAHFICDDPEQAIHSGELQYNDWPNLTIRNLVELIKMHESLELDQGVSVFDSTGVAIEDIAIAELIYELYDKHYGGKNQRG
jgi:alanine dehydrogenase